MRAKILNNEDPNYLYSLGANISSSGQQSLLIDVYDNGDLEENIYNTISLVGEEYSIIIDESHLDNLINKLQEIKNEYENYIKENPHFCFYFNRNFYRLVKYGNGYVFYRNKYRLASLDDNQEKALEFAKEYIIKDIQDSNNLKNSELIEKVNEYFENQV